VSQAPEHAPERHAEAPPPFLGSWRNVYIFVVCYLAALIAAFYVFSRAFAP
jgi:ABC-type transport system involved in multi-copper enzyme maturation permease subunit